MKCHHREMERMCADQRAAGRCKAVAEPDSSGPSAADPNHNAVGSAGAPPLSGDGITAVPEWVLETNTNQSGTTGAFALVSVGLRWGRGIFIRVRYYEMIKKNERNDTMDMENNMPKITESEKTITAEDVATPEALAKTIVQILDNKKAKDIKLLHVEKQTIIADYFVICTGNSRTQIKSLADEVEYKLSLVGVDPMHTEGADTGIWVLQDFGNVIVHIFNRDSRDFYKLDKLYMDTTEQDISNLLTEN